MNGYIHNGKSYQVMVLSNLEPLYGDPKYFSIAVALFHWIIQETKIILEDELVNIELDVIKVEYLGAYPCIGIHYKREDHPQDVEPIIEKTITRLLETLPVERFIDFITKSQRDWNTITGAILR